MDIVQAKGEIQLALVRQQALEWKDIVCLAGDDENLAYRALRELEEQGWIESRSLWGW